LMIAARSFNDITIWLLNHPNITVNARGHNGFTALHWAVIYDKHDNVRHLLSDDRIDISLTNKEGDTPLEMAMKMERDEIARLITDYKNRKTLQFEAETKKGREQRRGEQSDLKKKPRSTMVGGKVGGKRKKELHEKFNKLRF